AGARGSGRRTGPRGEEGEAGADTRGRAGRRPAARPRAADTPVESPRPDWIAGSMAYAPEYESVHARWYDPTHASRRNDAAFYLGLAREVGGPVLELGCGTGRLPLPIPLAGLPCPRPPP